MSTNKAQMMESMKKLLGRKLGKKLQDEAVALNTNFQIFLSLRTTAEICGYSDVFYDDKGLPMKISELKCVKLALENLRLKGMNKALAQLSEHSQLSAFLSESIEESGGGVNRKQYNKLMDDE